MSEQQDRPSGLTRLGYDLLVWVYRLHLGEVTAIFNSDTHTLDDGAASVNVSTVYLRNEDGGWACSGTDLETGDTVPSSNVADPTVTCVGQDGYQGLSAVVVIDDDGMLGFEGLIFSGDLPPVAEPPAAG